MPLQLPIKALRSKRMRSRYPCLPFDVNSSPRSDRPLNADYYDKDFKVDVVEVIHEDLLSHLPHCSKYIRKAMKSDGVVVYSLSSNRQAAVVVTAYLMHHKKMTLDSAWCLVDSEANLNKHLRTQLELYASMGFQLDENNSEYKVRVHT